MEENNVPKIDVVLIFGVALLGGAISVVSFFIAKF